VVAEGGPQKIPGLGVRKGSGEEGVCVAEKGKQGVCERGEGMKSRG